MADIEPSFDDPIAEAKPLERTRIARPQPSVTNCRTRECQDRIANEFDLFDTEPRSG
jgi:hypothetical protein